MIVTKLEIDFEPLKKALKIIEEEFTPTRNRNSLISENIRQKIQGYFNQGGQAGDEGPAWQKLSASRIAQKKQNKNTILVEFGKLKAGFVPSSDTKFASVKNLIPYAAQHQRGFDRTPARPMIPQKSSLMRSVEKVYIENLRRRLSQL